MSALARLPNDTAVQTDAPVRLFSCERRGRRRQTDKFVSCNALLGGLPIERQSSGLAGRLEDVGFMCNYEHRRTVASLTVASHHAEDLGTLRHDELMFTNLR